MAKMIRNGKGFGYSKTYKDEPEDRNPTNKGTKAYEDRMWRTEWELEREQERADFGQRYEEVLNQFNDELHKELLIDFLKIFKSQQEGEANEPKALQDLTEESQDRSKGVQDQG